MAHRGTCSGGQCLQVSADTSLIALCVAPALGLLPATTRPEVGGPPPSTDPKTVARNNGFCGHRRRRIFCFSFMARGEILFSPYVLVLKMLRFFRGFQMCQGHVKQFSAYLLPTLDFIPHIECWGRSTSVYIVRSFFLSCPLLGSWSASGFFLTRNDCSTKCPLCVHRAVQKFADRPG